MTCEQERQACPKCKRDYNPDDLYLGGLCFGCMQDHLDAMEVQICDLERQLAESKAASAAMRRALVAIRPDADEHRAYCAANSEKGFDDAYCNCCLRKMTTVIGLALAPDAGRSLLAVVEVARNLASLWERDAEPSDMEISEVKTALLESIKESGA